MTDPAAVIRKAFKGVSDDELDAMCRVAKVAVYPASHTLIHEGAIEHVFYIVAEGQVAITQRLNMNEKRVLALRNPGEFFGEMALIENKPRAASATTLVETTVLEISEEVFNEFLGNSPNMALAMIQRITANLRAADQASIAELARKNLELQRAYDDLKAAQAEIVKKERLEREMEIAGEVQRSLLPAHFPKVPGYSFAGRNVPARHVGGDLYDVIRIDDEHTGLLMADVSDKSVHAALIMAVTRTLYLSHARRHLSPVDVSLGVHHGLLEVSTKDDMFVTAFYGVLHGPTGRLRYVRAGQDEALLFRAAGGPPETLGAEGRFLGMLPDLTLEEHTVQLAPGDLLLTYSDGVTDAFNDKNESFGLTRLIDLVADRRHESAPHVCNAIFEGVFQFRGDAAAFDDITVLVARYDGPGGRAG